MIGAGIRALFKDEFDGRSVEVDSVVSSRLEVDGPEL